MSFNLTCNKCGVTKEINSENIGTYFKVYEYGYDKPPERDWEDQILMWWTEERCAETITCLCDNEVKGR